MLDIIETQDTLHDVVALISFLGTVSEYPAMSEEQKAGYLLCSEFAKDKIRSVIEELEIELKQ